jgi:hypothetical protein
MPYEPVELEKGFNNDVRIGTFNHLLEHRTNDLLEGSNGTQKKDPGGSF